MYTHVAKWGTSCAILLPKMVVETLGLYAGQSISINIEGNKLVLQKAEPVYNLNYLVAQMDVNNEPALLLDDNSQGQEIL